MQRRNTLRVASYNLHACVGSDGRFRPDRIVDVVEKLDADIIGLQEVEERRHGGQRVSDYLAEHLQMHAYTGPTLSRDAADYGNLLLTRSPVDELRRHDLSEPGREPRGAIEARLTVGDLKVRVLTTHLGLSGRERSRQIERLLEVLATDSADLDILLGDVNEWRPVSRVDRALKSHFGRQPRFRTFPASRPALSLDRILVKPRSRVQTSRAYRSSVSAIASDHLPVVADLRLN